MARFQTRSQVVTDALRQDIVWGDIEPGQKISQDEIAARYGVSRIPVREALRILASEGLVELRPHHEARARLHTPAELAELWWIRALLEPQLARLAVPRLDAAVLRSLERIVVQLDQLKQTPDIGQWLSLNRSFHLTLYKAADRPQLLRMVTELFDQSVRYIRVYLKAVDQFEQAQVEHRMLLEACVAHDGERLADLTRMHIQHGARYLQAVFEGLEGGKAEPPTSPPRSPDDES